MTVSNSLHCLLAVLDFPLPGLKFFALFPAGRHSRTEGTQQLVPVVEERLEVSQWLLVVHVVLGGAANHAGGVQIVQKEGKVEPNMCLY